MSNRIERLTILGGGSAGWITAMLLDTSLNSRRDGPPVEITLIESPKLGTIGVGEATVASMARMMAQCGIDEAEFFRRCNASFKMSVRFGNWSQDSNGQPIEFYHPFNTPPYLAGMLPAYHYHRYGPHQGCSDFADSMVVNTALVRARKGPRAIGGKNYESSIGYAYHVDAGLYGNFLRDIVTKRGVRHILDEVTEVRTDERGHISELQLAEGGTHAVEFIVDCSGFRSRVLQQALGEPFDSFSDNLLCDRAIPVQLPHRDVTKIAPCTQSTALGAGWVWRVPLYSRVGTGYVYSSAFRSEDEAAAEFFQHLRAVGDLPADAPDPDVRVIPMKIGRTRRAWVKNCVAIGLSGGFIEPLESTAIFIIEIAARNLVALFPDKGVSPAVAAHYNKIMARLSDEVRDFIVSHYLTSNRPEPFWRAARSDVVVPDSLQARMELWRHVLPDIGSTMPHTLFNYWNYLYTLWPKGYFDSESFPLEGSISRQAWDRFGAELAAQKQQLLSSLPDHYELVTSIRGDAPQAFRASPEPAPSDLPETLRRRLGAQATVPMRFS